MYFLCGIFFCSISVGLDIDTARKRLLQSIVQIVNDVVRDQ